MPIVNVPNTSVVYSNPKQIDQASNLDPTTGATWSPGNQPYTFTVPSTPPTFKVGFNPLTPGTQATTTTGSNPQPGTFDPTPPRANPVGFSAASLSDSPPAPTVVGTPVVNPTASNAVRNVNVSGPFGKILNPA